jgi:hypothetical protein
VLDNEEKEWEEVRVRVRVGLRKRVKKSTRETRYVGRFEAPPTPYHIEC